MGKVSEVLSDSFRLLLDEPKLFVPKIFSTLTASLFIVYLLSNIRGLTQTDPLLTTSGILVGLVLLSVLGIYSSMMLSSMVKRKDSSLIQSFLEVKGNISDIISTSLAFVALSFAISSFGVMGYFTYIMTGELYVLAIFALLFLAALLGVSYVSYFLPITLLEKGGLRSALGNSFRTSENNRKVVLALLLLSIALISLAVFSTGYLEKLGYAGFVAGRLVSSVVNTYIFTVSPTYYLELGTENLD